jgi:hypothetical protein
MRLTRRTTFWRAFPRRVGVCAALVAYLVAAVGFPVPAAALSTHPSHCAAASQSCCCPSAAQAAGCCCCAGRHHSADTDPAPVRPCCRNKHAAPSRTLWVGGPSALGCHGLSTVWIASGAVTPPPASVAWQSYAPPGDWLTTSRADPVGVALIPPDPPPRRVSSGSL